MSVGIVCGGRGYQWGGQDVGWLEACVRTYGIYALMHGDCKTGADTILRDERVKERLLRAAPDGWLLIMALPVLWDPTPGHIERGRGPERNTRMIDAMEYFFPEGPLVCLAFPGNRGTADTVNKCARREWVVVRAHAHPKAIPAQETLL